LTLKTEAACSSKTIVTTYERVSHLPAKPNHILNLYTLTLKMEAACFFETLVSICRAVRCHIPKDHNLNTGWTV
jgi:hypothetical protein